MSVYLVVRAGCLMLMPLRMHDLLPGNYEHVTLSAGMIGQAPAGFRQMAYIPYSLRAPDKGALLVLTDLEG